jgi:HupE / UreJ protein
VHAWRPIFPGREFWVAAGFGLVHGASFASVIAAQRFDAWHRVVAMLGFNLGIEVMQVAVVAAALPCLLLLCSLPVYRFVRDIGAAFAALAALGWVLERTVGIANPLEGLVDRIAGDAPLVILSATAIALALRVLALAARDANTSPLKDEGEPVQDPHAPSQARTA